MTVATMTGCSLTQNAATEPAVSLPLDQGRRLALLALEQLGAPYRFGGDSPQGFDCSGLVRFVHTQAKLNVPRTAADQQRAATAVSMAELQAGDLLFFRVGGAHIDHVAIYQGDGSFVHAPSSGHFVSKAALGEDYYQRRLVSAGRFWR